jgi:hypothetical protein
VWEVAELRQGLEPWEVLRCGVWSEEDQGGCGILAGGGGAKSCAHLRPSTETLARTGCLEKEDLGSWSGVVGSFSALCTHTQDMHPAHENTCLSRAPNGLDFQTPLGGRVSSLHHSI